MNKDVRRLLIVLPIAGIILVSCAPTPKKAGAPPAELTTDEPGMVPPELVTLQEVSLNPELKNMTVIVGNAKGVYTLSCATEASGCVSPDPGRSYMLFKNHTRYRINNAKEPLTLKLMQDWTVSYNNGDNVGLIPQVGNGSGMGFSVYRLDGWKVRAADTK